MRTPASSFTLVLAAFTIMFAAGCRDEVAVALDEIEATQQEILALLEQRVAFPPAEVATAAAAEQNARMSLEKAGLTSNDVGVWRNEAGAISCGLYRYDDGPLCVAWQEAHNLKSRHDDARKRVNNRANRYAQRLEALQRAREDDTWDVLEPFNPNASGRSIVITYLRELEDELEDERARLQSTTDAPTR